MGHAQDPARDFGFGALQIAFAKATDPLLDPAALHYDDSQWSEVSVPHDWGVELPFVAPIGLDILGKTDPRAAHGYKPLGREFPDTSVGWYRLVMDLPQTDLGRRLSLEFDGAFRDCVVFVNGYLLAENHSGYAPFRVDLTDVANYGGRNVILLRVDASQGEGWFYEGAGVYRPVWLVKTDPLHVPQWGAVVRPTLTEGLADLAIGTEVANESDKDAPCEVVSTILDADGRAVGEARSQVSAPAWGKPKSPATSPCRSRSSGPSRRPISTGSRPRSLSAASWWTATKPRSASGPSASIQTRAFSSTASR